VLSDEERGREASALFTEWASAHWIRGLTVNADFAPDDEAEQWIDDHRTACPERLVSGALAAMAHAGVKVERGPIMLRENRLYVVIEGQELMARDLIDGSPNLAVSYIFGRLDEISAGHGRNERWRAWYTGDPVGAAFFVTPDQLITSAKIDVRQLNTGGSDWWDTFSTH
jgi:hypothetical protein